MPFSSCVSAAVVGNLWCLSNPFVTYAMLQSNVQLDEYWQDRFGRPKGPIHSTFAHLLGNLSLITGIDNIELSNKPFDEKVDILE